MFWISERLVPAIATALWLLFLADNWSWLSSLTICTLSCNCRSRVPLLPLMETLPLAIWASTPLGNTTGALAILDIILLFNLAYQYCSMFARGTAVADANRAPAIKIRCKALRHQRP